MYFKQIAKALDPNRKEKKKATIADVSASESETDDDGEMIEKMYISENYGQGKNDEKHAANMLKQFQKDGEGKGEDKTEEDKLQEETDQWEDVQGIEEMLKEQNE